MESWAAKVGAEGPISENSSREIPSGFFECDELVRLGCDGPAETPVSRASALRMSAAEAFMVVKSSVYDHVGHWAQHL